MDRIRRLSRGFRLLFLIGLVVLPPWNIVFWWYFNEFMALKWFGRIGDVSLHNLPLTFPIPPLERCLGFVVALIPIGVEMFVLLSLARLFGLYAKGEIFSGGNVRLIRRIAYAILIGEALSPVYQALMSVALTLNNPPGHRMLSIGISSLNLSLVVVAFMIIVVAWIMDEGRKLREEQDLVI